MREAGMKGVRKVSGGLLTRTRPWALLGLLLGLGLTASCTLTMRDQPRYEPFEESTFFADHSSARPRLADTVARGQLPANELLTTGRVNGEFTQTFPFTVTQAVLERGQERYTIYCTPCHDLLGTGQGIITQYGMREPPSFHDPSLRDEPNGYYFATITDGTRIMPSYAARISPEDRWAIVAYIRALQLSQNTDAAKLPPNELPKLEATEPITP
jgi:mono/diheme cytochrome c family protein